MSGWGIDDADCKIMAQCEGRADWRTRDQGGTEQVMRENWVRFSGLSW